ncbi:MAG: hypothetical protein ACYDAC_02305 [Candidatus Dormibacteria bacterium]
MPIDTEAARWESAGGSRSPDRYQVTVHSGCVRVAMDAAAPPSAPPLPPPEQPPETALSAPVPAPRQLAVSLILDGVERRLTSP